MFITDKLVYIQLQKTGCTHIAKLLDQTVGGELKLKHSPATPELMDSSRTFISSIRDPWEWYVSLWSYGCDENGGFRKRVTRLNRPCKDLAKNPFKLAIWIYNELTKKRKLWQACYADSSDPELFRQWIKMIYNPEFRFDIGEGYGESAISKFVGIYTYRYLKLCCKNIEIQDYNAFNSFEDILIFEKKNCYISKWIRNKSLEHDLINILVSSGEKISEEDKKRILSSKKTNTSSRSQPTSFYYDRDTAELVRKKEALIVKKFDYCFPEDEI